MKVFISENYLDVMDSNPILKRELEKRSGVHERSAAFIAGDIRNEDKVDLRDWMCRRGYAKPIA